MKISFALWTCLVFAMCRKSQSLASRSSDHVNNPRRAVALECDDEAPSSPPCGDDLYTFGASLFSTVAKNRLEEENIVLSPLSAAISIALVAVGATPSSDCEKELLFALGIQSHRDVPELAEDILGSAGGADAGVTLTAVASVWSKQINEAYIDSVQADHAAEARELPDTYGPVNDWIEEATDQLITDLFDGNEAIDDLTSAILVSAVHFKGMWTHKFDPEVSEDDIFHVSGGGTDTENVRPARFMKARRHMFVNERVEHLGGASVLRLDYGESQAKGGHTPEPKDFCALVILPAAPNAASMTKVVNGLTSAPIAETLDLLHRREVELSLPRFRVEWGADSLKDALRNMGVKDAFDGSDVFSVMSDDPKVHLDDVLHKAVMEVTEEGTVAAAATAAVMMSRSMPPPPLELTFNRPFVMLVLHVPTGTPLFMARLVEPELLIDGVQNQ